MKKTILIVGLMGFIAYLLNATPQNFNLAETLDAELCNSKALKTDASVLEGKTVLFYFSAKWCPPCQQFTPILVDFHKKHRAQLEVVFVSWDKSVDEMKAYINQKQMGYFYCIRPDSSLNRSLSETFDVNGIPAVVVIGPSGKVVTKNGRRHIASSQALPAAWTQ